MDLHIIYSEQEVGLSLRGMTEFGHENPEKLEGIFDEVYKEWDGIRLPVLAFFQDNLSKAGKDQYRVLELMSGLGHFRGCIPETVEERAQLIKTATQGVPIAQRWGGKEPIKATLHLPGSPNFEETYELLKEEFNLIKYHVDNLEL